MPYANPDDKNAWNRRDRRENPERYKAYNRKSYAVNKRPAMYTKCRHCDELFEVKRGQRGRPLAFCSRECRVENTRTTHTRACLVCNRSFQTTGLNLMCSSDCARERRRAKDQIRNKRRNAAGDSRRRRQERERKIAMLTLFVNAIQPEV